MYYRQREQKPKRWRGCLTGLGLLLSTGLLAFLVAVYIGYFEVEVPVLADAFRPTPTATRPPVLDIADGDELFARGKLQEAINAYEQAIRSDPDNDVPYMRQSRLLIFTRNSAKAVERAAEAVLLNPESPENLAAYCRALDWEARYQEAFEACSCAIELDEDYAPAYAYLSEVYADQGNWRLAEDYAQQAIDTDYQSLAGHLNMGYALEVQGRYQAASEFYENAIKLAPKLGPLYVRAGQVYYALGDYELAIDRFRQAIRLSPFDPEPYNWLGWTYYITTDYIRAIDAFEQSIAVDPTFVTTRRGTSAWGNMAYAYYSRQNFEEAVQLFPKAIELAENDFARRARQVEIFTEVDTLVGPEAIPVLRGQFEIPADNIASTQYVAEFEPVVYRARSEFEADETCAAPIVRELRNVSALLGPAQSMTTTAIFSQATGIATLDLATGRMILELEDLPDPPLSPYEIRVTFWPNRVDAIGLFEPDGSEKARVNILFEERLDAPIEYYYGLGLSHTYLEPRQCEAGMPYLLKALDMDLGIYNPAWAGLRRCPPHPDAPPTPYPTATPSPTPELN